MTKSRKRMLLSSIAMLLVALVALGSATYAWFTINKEVIADTIKVQANVADGLVITNLQDNTGWTRTVSYNTTNKELNPVSVNVTATDGTAGLGTPYYARDVKRAGAYEAANEGNQNIASASSFTTASIPASYDASPETKKIATNNYFAVYGMRVASSGAAIDGTVTAAITATGTGTNFAKAALLDSSNNVIGFYSDDRYSAITSDVPATNQVIASKTTGISVYATQVPVQSDATDFKLVVWFEGNDEHCDNSGQGHDANFTVTFTLA